MALSTPTTTRAWSVRMGPYWYKIFDSSKTEVWLLNIITSKKYWCFQYCMWLICVFVSLRPPADDKEPKKTLGHKFWLKYVPPPHPVLNFWFSCYSVLNQKNHISPSLLVRSLCCDLTASYNNVYHTKLPNHQQGIARWLESGVGQYNC